MPLLLFFNQYICLLVIVKEFIYVRIRKKTEIKSPRRRFLLTSLVLGVGVVPLALSGCGGGGNPIVTPTPAPDPTPMPSEVTYTLRLEPTGDLKNQIEQFSKGMDELGQVLNAPNAEVDIAVSGLTAITRSRQADTRPAEDFYRAAIYGSLLSVLACERTMDALISLDSVLYAADVTTTKQNLKDRASLSNPAFGTAMYKRLVNALAGYTAITRYFLLAGIPEMIGLVLNASTPEGKRVAYSMLRDAYNGFLDHLPRGSQIDASLRLRATVAMTNAAIDAEVNRITPLLSQIPLGVGYRTKASKLSGAIDTPAVVGKAFIDCVLELSFARALDLPGGTVTTNSLNSWLTSLSISNRMKSNLSVQNAVYQNLTQSGRTLATIDSTLLDSSKRSIVLANLQSTLQGVGGVSATNLSKVATETLGLIANLGPFLGGLDIIKGTLGITLVKGENLTSYTTRLVALLEQLPPATRPDTQSLLPLAQNPLPTEIAKIRIPSTSEQDQLNSASLSLQSVKTVATISTPVTPSAIADARSILGGTVTTSTPPPRTFSQINRAAYTLMLDYLSYVGHVTLIRIDGAETQFTAADIALLINRSAGATQMTVPVITSAQLMCTAPGYLPSRTTTPVNLTTLESLPPLQRLT